MVNTRLVMFYYGLLAVALIGQTLFTIYSNSKTLKDSQLLYDLTQQQKALTLKKQTLLNALADQSSLPKLQEQAEQQGYIPITKLISLTQ